MFLTMGQTRIYISNSERTITSPLSNGLYSIFILKTVIMIDHSGVTTHLIIETPAKLY